MFTNTCSVHCKIAPPKKAMMVLGLCCTMMLFVFSAKAAPVSLDLKLGKMADYGASPWYTEDIKLGKDQLKLSPDSGANFIWATSDLCNTDACNVHSKVDTSQPGFKWIDKTPAVRSFGPWGSMSTVTGEIAFNSPKTGSAPMPFFASVCYTGNQFEYLAWDGGIGFPAVSDGVQQGSGFYFGSLYKNGTVEKPTFSIVTHPSLGSGSLYLGGEDSSQYIANSAIELQPNTTGPINYLWGTSLYSASFGDQKISSLTNARFYLDTGSSLFKGDNLYLKPILKHLYSLLDENGNRIFEKVFNPPGSNNWVSLVYRNNTGPKDYAGILPDFTLTMGQTCAGKAGSAMIALNPTQYSYYVQEQEGERFGRWVPAFTVLDGVGGLLVGSTFMDLFYTTFNYADEGNSKLTQKNMVIYRKSSGDGPQNLHCVSTPSVSPIAGTWYNSYCSQVNLSISPAGEITGVYTSHTGSTGSSNVIGWVGSSANPFPKSAILPANPKGTPVALGIQWRLINQPISIILKANMETGNVTGEYATAGDKFIVTGLADIIGGSRPPSTAGKVVEQGVALTMSDGKGNVLSMAGGVDLSDPKIMNLWVDELASTTWTNRFMESTVNKFIWTRVQ